MRNGGLAEFHDLEPATESFREAVLTGLSKPVKELSPKFFYDERGSILFDEITELDEYYVTRTEIALLREHDDKIAALVGPHSQLVEFGSGSSRKIRILLDEIKDIASYVPIDISREHLKRSAEDLAEDYPHIDIVAVCADYTQPFELPDPPRGAAQKRVGFFPGSTIGNFSRAQARAFLENAAGLLETGGEMLVGVDLKKDEEILRAAYNDSAGITAAFNLNMLTRINRELDGDFDVDTFTHEARYNAGEGRVEMHLVSDRDQIAHIGDRQFDFAEGESIHTENSYKFGIDEFHNMAAPAGFDPIETWTDPADLFSLHYLRAS